MHRYRKGIMHMNSQTHYPYQYGKSGMLIISSVQCNSGRVQSLKRTNKGLHCKAILLHMLVEFMATLLEVSSYFHKIARI